MIICPNCRTENRTGAKFCKSCAVRLPTSFAVSQPLDASESFTEQQMAESPAVADTQTARRSISVLRTDTQSLNDAPGFERRPRGAIFGGNYLFEAVLYSDERQHRYQVHQLDVPEDSQILVCPNLTCGAVFPPQSAGPERFCTDCGTALEPGGKNLVVIEANTPVPDNIAQAVAKRLSHGSVRAPLDAFVESLAGQPRHCVVVSYVNTFEGTADALQALKWGVSLARGLEYLHDNGVAFGDQIETGHIGLADGHPVWANFTNCIHHPEGYVLDRKPDTTALAKLVFQWLTQKKQFEPDHDLPPALNRAFEPFYMGAEVEDGSELAELFERALQLITSPEEVDFRLGRRTHVGLVRNLNEDSLLTLELNRTQQSVSQPIGVFVIADGMGGHTAGEIASGTIINSIAKKAIKDLVNCQLLEGSRSDCQKWLQDAVEAANADVFALRKTSGTDMGSTLVAAVLESNKAYITHVGDSRAYLIKTHGIQQLTLDHSLVEQLIVTNQITREEARFHPQRNVIYRTIGDTPKIEVEVATNLLSVGDYLLLCSDGLTGMLNDQTILKIVLEASSPQAACDALVDAANTAGGEDNVSVVIVQIVQP
jgi:serine/threonine protein phosphatase PrpC